MTDHLLSVTAQPKALYSICVTNLWERFGYYMMRGILVLYMTKVLSLSNAQSYGIFAAFISLLFLSPLIGGHIADVYLGAKRSVLLGSLLLSLGYFCLAIPGDPLFYIGLAIVVCGSGFFIPSISTVLGDLYQAQDARREGGFSLLYAAINLGAFIPPLIAAGIIARFGWHTAFAMAGLGVLLSFIIFYVSIDQIEDKAGSSFSKYLVVFVGSIVSAVGIVFLIKHSQIASGVLFAASGLLILYTLIRTVQFTALTRNRLLICLVLTGFSIVFCVLCEQAAMSLTIYTEYNVNRLFYQWEIPTVSFLSLNPLFIIACGPLLSKGWTQLEKINCNPSIPVKFATGTLLVGISFVIFPLAMTFCSHQGQIHFGWIVASYFIQSLGELLVYPVGLSMMTELAPKQMVGLMIGMWYLATAIANVLGGVASRLTTLASGSNDPLLTSDAYRHIFNYLGWIAVASALFIYVCTPLFKRFIAVQPDV